MLHSCLQVSAHPFLVLTVVPETNEDRTQTVDDRLADFTRLVGRPFLRSVDNNLAYRFPDIDMTTLGALDGLFNPQRYPEEKDEKLTTYGEASVCRARETV